MQENLSYWPVEESVFNWSGGKDAALCLHKVLQGQQYSINRLLTTLSAGTQRISMHGVREELLEQQAHQLGLPLQKLYLPEHASMQAYNNLMETTLRPLREAGITKAIFGDIHLQDLRNYREQQLQQVGMEAVFPLWQRPTAAHVQEFIHLGFKAVVVCVNERLLGSSFVGRELDMSFLQDLPPTVDPAGENGEYHTFVYDGPIFKQPIPFALGEKVRKTYGPPSSSSDNCFKDEEEPTYDTAFWFCDLLPA